MIDVADPVARAKAIAGLMQPYELGAGDYAPVHTTAGVLIADMPWTRSERGVLGCDCSGFVCYCHRMKRHAPGFNAGGTISDDINTVSTVEDALGKRTRFTPIIAPTLKLAGMPKAGDVLVYRTIWLPGHPHPWIGHECLVLEVDPRFDPAAPDWRLVKVAQCFGGNGRAPAVEITDGLFWREHDEVWGRDRATGAAVPERKSVVVRVNQAA